MTTKQSIDRRIVSEVVDRYDIPRKKSSAIVRLVIEHIMADLERCEHTLADPDVALGVRIARARLSFAKDRTT